MGAALPSSSLSSFRASDSESDPSEEELLESAASSASSSAMRRSISDSFDVGARNDESEASESTLESTFSSLLDSLDSLELFDEVFDEVFDKLFDELFEVLPLLCGRSMVQVRCVKMFDYVSVPFCSFNLLVVLVCFTINIGSKPVVFLCRRVQEIVAQRTNSGIFLFGNLDLILFILILDKLRFNHGAHGNTFSRSSSHSSCKAEAVAVQLYGGPLKRSSHLVYFLSEQIGGDQKQAARAVT